MATDVEEPDTDDHEKPAPPKRQCTRLSKVNETCWNTEKHTNITKEIIDESMENNDFDDAERHARDKLKRWQAFQVAKGFVDNTINKVLENYIMTTAPYSLEDSRFCLFRGNDMEDAAVMMAIRNHGLVQSAELVSQSHAFYSDKAPGYWTNSEHIDIHCSCPSNRMQSIESFPTILPTMSSDPLRLSNSVEMGKCNETEWDADKVYDSDQQKDFLERAVAEAIKKKGLSALSVDYG